MKWMGRRYIELVGRGYEMDGTEMYRYRVGGTEGYEMDGTEVNGISGTKEYGMDGTEVHRGSGTDEYGMGGTRSISWEVLKIIWTYTGKITFQILFMMAIIFLYISLCYGPVRNKAIHVCFW